MAPSTRIRNTHRSAHASAARAGAAAVVLALLALTSLPRAASAVNLTVNGASQYQVIDGMGHNINVENWGDDDVRPALDLLIDVNGTSLVRVVRDPMTWVSSESMLPALHALDPATLAQVYEAPEMQEIWNTIAYLNHKGLRGNQILLNFMGWTPTWLGGGGRYGYESRLTSGKEDELAIMIASLVYYGRRVKNLDFTLLSPINEQDWNGLEGPIVGPSQYTTLLAALVDELNSMGLTEIRLVGPDTACCPASYVSSMMGNSKVAARVDHFAFHDYNTGTSASPGQSYAGKNYWLTETGPGCSGCSDNTAPGQGEWQFSLDTADMLLGDLANGLSTVLLWEGYDGFYYHHNEVQAWGLLARNGSTYTPRKRFWVNSQFTKFIRPGMRRIGLTESISGVGTVVAFQDATRGSLVITGRVTGSSPVSIQGQLTNLSFPVGTLMLYQTTSTTDLQRAADVTVSGGIFNVTLPGNSVFTLVSNGNTAPTASIVSPADGTFYAAGQNIQLAASASDAQTPADALTYEWTVDLVFGSHTQTGYATYTGRNVSFPAQNLDDGTGVRQVIHLTVRDPGGLVSDTSTVTIWPDIDLEPAALVVSPASPTAGQGARVDLFFTNHGTMPAPASHWVLRAGDTVLGQGDLAVPAQSTVSPTPQAMSVMFDLAGNVPLRLTLDTLEVVHETNEANESTTKTVVVKQYPGNVAPVAAVSASPVSGPVPLTVNFSGAGSSDANGDSLFFDWAFGDGRSGVGRLESNTYTAVGTYVALLTVRDGRGSQDTAAVTITVTAGGFPQAAILDGFNRANGAIGGSWVDQTSAYTISSNSLLVGSGVASIEWSGATYGANQEAFVNVTPNTSGSEHNLMLKVQGSSWQSGHIEVSYNAPTSRVFIRTFTPPSTWTTYATIDGVTFSAGNQFGARAFSDGTVRVYRNGTLVGSGSVAGWTFASQGGRIGLSVSNVQGARFDDFGGGNADAPPAPTVSVPPVESGIARLSDAIPNPTRGGASLSLVLAAQSEVAFTVVDVMGREQWSVPATTYGPGSWTLRWDSASAPTGIYMARVRVGGQVLQRRIAVLH